MRCDEAPASVVRPHHVLSRGCVLSLRVNSHLGLTQHRGLTGGQEARVQQEAERAFPSM